MNWRRIILIALAVLIGLQAGELFFAEHAELPADRLRTTEALDKDDTNRPKRPKQIFRIDNLLDRAHYKIRREVELFIFGEKKLNADRLLTMSMRIAGDAQVWLDPSGCYGCSSRLAPIERRSDFKGANIDLGSLGYPINRDGVYVDREGRFETAVNEGHGIFVIKGHNERLNNLVVVKVKGKRSDDISIEVRNLK